MPADENARDGKWGKVLAHLGKTRVSSDMRHCVDEFLLSAGEKGEKESRPDLASLVQIAAGKRLAMDSKGERWDVVSTGCASDLTELIGHLWLRVRRKEERDAGKENPLIVPKIAARRGSVGFSDVLESGAYPLAARRSDFRHEIEERGIAVARGDAMIAPVGAELRRRSRDVGAERNAAVTCLEILSDLATAGVNRAVVDVKCGFDTKLRSRWKRAEEVEGRAEVTEELVEVTEELVEVTEELVEVTEALHCNEIDKVDHLRAILEYIGLSAVYDVAPDHTVVTSKVERLPQVTWLLTNADVPQSRAIGRTLALLHLKGLLTGSYGQAKDGSELLEHLFWKDGTMVETEYAQFYVAFLGKLCGINEPKKAHVPMKEAWDEFEKKLPFLKSDDIAREVPEWMADFAPDVTMRWNRMDVNDELEVCSIGAYPYCVGPKGPISSKTKVKKVQSIDAYRLERFLLGSAGKTRKIHRSASGCTRSPEKIGRERSRRKRSRRKGTRRWCPCSIGPGERRNAAWWSG